MTPERAAADDWWTSLSEAEKRTYLEAHPKSIYNRDYHYANARKYAQLSDKHRKSMMDLLGSNKSEAVFHHGQAMMHYGRASRAAFNKSPTCPKYLRHARDYAKIAASRGGDNHED